MRKLIYTLLIIITLTNNSFSAGSSSDNDSTPKMSDYTKAKNLVNNSLILKPLNKMKKFN